MTPTCITVEVSPTAHGAAEARRAVEQILAAWSLLAFLSTASLVASELVTNAVLHAPGEGPLRLRLQRDQHGLRISLADHSPKSPVVARPGPNAAHGRGMQLIDALAASWGTEPQPDGKWVWVQLSSPSL